MKNNTIVIIGLGLMGGSFAYALKNFKNSIIIGVDNDPIVCENALKKGAVDKIDNISNSIKQADLVIFCTHPVHILQSLEQYAHIFKKDSIITEICGVKRHISQTAIKFLPENVDYVGIHPMAGKEVSGFSNADKEIFKNCGFIITPIESTKNTTIELMKNIANHIGTDRIAVLNAENHDSQIAYSSDLMHISASALCTEFPNEFKMTYTAGAFRDCTRIAQLNPDLWADLLIENSIETEKKLAIYIENLTAFKQALNEKNRDSLRYLLDKGNQNKQEMQKR